MSDMVNFEGGCGYPGNSHRSEAEASKEQEKTPQKYIKKKKNETRQHDCFDTALLGVSRNRLINKDKELLLM